MRVLVRGRMFYEGLPFPTPSTEVRYFEDLGILVEPGAPRDFFHVVYELSSSEVRLILVTHPHLDHLFNAIAFKEAEVTRNPKRNRRVIGGRWDDTKERIRDSLRLRIVEPKGREELEEDVYVKQTDLHYPGHLVFVVRGIAFVGDSFPPVPEIKGMLSRGEKYKGRAAEHMRDVAEMSEVIVTAHRGEISSEEVLEVLRFFLLAVIASCIGSIGSWKS